MDGCLKSDMFHMETGLHQGLMRASLTGATIYFTFSRHGPRRLFAVFSIQLSCGTSKIRPGIRIQGGIIIDSHYFQRIRETCGG